MHNDSFLKRSLFIALISLAQCGSLAQCFPLKWQPESGLDWCTIWCRGRRRTNRTLRCAGTHLGDVAVLLAVEAATYLCVPAKFDRVKFSSES